MIEIISVTRSVCAQRLVQQHYAGERGKRSSYRSTSAVPAPPDGERWAPRAINECLRLWREVCCRAKTRLCAMLSALGSTTPGARYAVESTPSLLCEGYMFANIDELHSELLEKEPKDFVSHYLFDLHPVPVILRKWKLLLS